MAGCGNAASGGARQRLLTIFVTPPAPDRRTEYCDERVCLRLCACPRAYLQNVQSSRSFYVHVAYARGSDSFGRCCNRITENIMSFFAYSTSLLLSTLLTMTSWSPVSHLGLVSIALFSARSSHICHLVASVSNVKPTCLPGTFPPAVSPKALSLVHYSSSCSPLLSVPSFPLD